jgi:hypothetical protein
MFKMNLLALMLAVSGVSTAALPQNNGNGGEGGGSSAASKWSLKKFTNLITFGDR